MGELVRVTRQPMMEQSGRLGELVRVTRKPMMEERDKEEKQKR